MRPVGRRIIAVGAISAGLAVAVGAFGAHALEGRVNADMLANYETGARYHFYHSLGLIAVGLMALLHGAPAGGTGDRSNGGNGAHPYAGLSRLRWSAALMLTGIVLFSGSLYTMALTGLGWLGAVTPLGGVAFLAAWALLAWAALDG
jgi:uncharacterized membrane protein YgdD (TMEM256/DUF423 family)